MGPSRQLAKNPLDLPRFLEGLLGQLAVRLGRVPRLDEEAGAGAGVADHRARDLPPAPRGDREHVPSVAKRDEALRTRKPTKERLEPRCQPGPQRPNRAP